MSDAADVARAVGARWAEDASAEVLGRVLRLADGVERCGWVGGIATRLAEVAAGEELNAREREETLARLGFCGSESEREAWARAFLAGVYATIRTALGMGEGHPVPEVECQICAMWIGRARPADDVPLFES